MKLIAIAALGGLIVAAIFTAVSSTGVQPARAAPEDKETICHAAGRSGTDHFNEINVSENAGSSNPGNGGHYNEPGTTAAGHEEDGCAAGSQPPATPANPPAMNPPGGGDPVTSVVLPGAALTTRVQDVQGANAGVTEVKALPSTGGGPLESQRSAAPAIGLIGIGLIAAAGYAVSKRQQAGA